MILLTQNPIRNCRLGGFSCCSQKEAKFCFCALQLLRAGLEDTPRRIGRSSDFAYQLRPGSLDLSAKRTAPVFPFAEFHFDPCDRHCTVYPRRHGNFGQCLTTEIYTPAPEILQIPAKGRILFTT